MRHNKHHASLGVTREHRKAMLANMAVSLLNHGRIQTTLTKAKALRPFVEKVITKAKKASVKTEKKDAIHLRRLAVSDLRDETTVTQLFNEGVKEFANRPGGYTRIYKLGNRIGDAAGMALVELVKADDPGYGKKAKAKGKKSARKAEKPAEAPAAEAPAEAAPAAEAATEAPKA
ncbi:50S ribosomal protein L17 [Opitutaceae bacterium TAV5]|nr:50S ribosomal protein L17 [Opitutaceae bacterium TAV5]